MRVKSFRLYRDAHVRFVSNESTTTRKNLAKKLARLGIEINPEHVFTPAPVAARYVQSQGLRPYLLIHPGK